MSAIAVRFRLTAGKRTSAVSPACVIHLGYVVFSRIARTTELTPFGMQGLIEVNPMHIETDTHEYGVWIGVLVWKCSTT